MSETQKIIENLSFTGIEEIDPAAIERFFLDTLNVCSVDPADAMQAAVMLWAIRRGVRGGDDMNVELRQLLQIKKAKHPIEKEYFSVIYILYKFEYLNFSIFSRKRNGREKRQNYFSYWSCCRY